MGRSSYLVIMVLAVPPERPDQQSILEQSGLQEIGSQTSLELLTREIKVAG